MTTQDESRKLMAKERQHREHLKENILGRSVEEVKTHMKKEITDEQARELIARERRHDQHLKENMSSRTTEEINK